VQALRDALQAVLEPAPDRRGAELQPLLEQRPQAEDGGPAVEADDVDVDANGPLELRRREQVVHQRIEIDLGFGHEHEPRRILVVGLVA
jgi:hypothetical protein